MVYIELDSDKLYKRKVKSDKTVRQTTTKFTMLNLCCNCFVDECYQLGCIGETSEGMCECSNDHSDHHCY